MYLFFALFSSFKAPLHSRKWDQFVVSTSLSAMAMRGVFLVLFVTFGTWAQETPIDNGEAVDESLKGLLVNNSLAEE